VQRKEDANDFAGHERPGAAFYQKDIKQYESLVPIRDALSDQLSIFYHDVKDDADEKRSNSNGVKIKSEGYHNKNPGTTGIPFAHQPVDKLR